MPFSYELLKASAKEINVPSVGLDFEYAKELIYGALAVMSETNLHINPDELDIYVHGSYASNVNIYFPSNLEIVVELKRTLEFDPEIVAQTGYQLFNNYFVNLGLDFGVAEFRAELFGALSAQLPSKVSESDKAIVVAPHKNLKHTLEITPAFSFRHVQHEHGRIYHGIVIHDAGVGADIVTFPKLHAFNGHGKDLATNKNFKSIVRMFKTLNAIGEREFDFPSTRGYFIQCLLFNVPSDMFVVRDRFLLALIEEGEDTGAMLHQIFLKVVNYLTHANLENFQCQNTVWKLFGNAAEFWSFPAARAFIRNIKKLYSSFPESRVKLA